VLLIATAVLLLALVGIFAAINTRQNALRDSIREDILWAIYQFDRETRTLANLIDHVTPETTLTEPGLIVYRFDAPLVFANAAYFTERLESLVANAGPGLKCVILDAEPISDFDSTAAEALENLDASLERLGVELWIARANGPLRDLLQVTGLTTRIGEDNLHPSVRSAVTAYRARFGTA